MAYWWVNQGHTFKHEFDGGYLWAPIRNEKGAPFHWTTMTEVRPGDTIFSYYQKAFRAIAIADSEAYESKKPQELEQPDLRWAVEGRRLDAKYRRLDEPLPLRDIIEDLFPLLPTKYSPVNKNMNGNDGYLFSLPPKAGRLLADKIQGIDDLVLNVDVSASADKKTTAQRLVNSRIGQGDFRDDLLRIWKRKCCVSGSTVLPLLQASHIMPWRDSNNNQRLDPYNGLLLSPTYNAAFDKGYITFEDDGSIRLSPSLTSEQIEHLGINPKAKIQNLSSSHLTYLDYHRKTVFKP